MKHMLALLPQPEPTPTLSQESLDETLAMEGMSEALKKPFVALKKAFPLTTEEAFTHELKLKRNVLVQEKKNLEKARAALSKAKDSGEHTVNLKKVIKRINFSASTPAQLIAGFQKNRKFVNGLITEMQSVHLKADAEKIKDRFDAEMNKRGNVKEEMSVSKSDAIKLLDESILMTQSLIDFLDALDKLKSAHLTTEGLGDFVTGFFVGVIRIVLGLAAAVFLWYGGMLFLALIFAQPWFLLLLTVPALVVYGLSTSSTGDHAEHLLANH